MIKLITIIIVLSLMACGVNYKYHFIPVDFLPTAEKQKAEKAFNSATSKKSGHSVWVDPCPGKPSCGKH